MNTPSKSSERVAPLDAQEARRLELMASAWRSLAPSELEVAAKRRRALARALKRPRRPRPFVWGVVALLASAAVFAAGGVVVRTWGDGSAGMPAASAPSAFETVPTKKTVAAPAVASSPPRDAEPEQVVSAGRTGESFRDEAPVQRPRSETPSRSAQAPKPASTTSDGWSAVRDALRDGDGARARAKLDALAHHEDAATRDAAALARAQLDGARGDRERARSELVRLSTSGATKSIRAQAARSLERLDRP